VALAKPFSYNIYLPPDEPHAELLPVARALLDGSFQNDWTNRNNKRRIAGKRLVKDIRLHHFLKWLAVQFPGMPIVFVLRHPLAVVESRQALEWPARLELFDGPDLRHDHLEPFTLLLEKGMAFGEQSFERQVLFWCIENYVPLAQFRAAEMHVAFYEHLVTRPEDEARRLFAYLNKPFESRVLDALAAPSSQTRTDSAVHTNESKLERWRRAFSPQQVAWAVETLNAFGLDRLYTDALVPQVENERVLRP
jgi:hypothetical protein